MILAVTIHFLLVQTVIVEQKIEKYSRKYGVEKHLLMAMVKVESSFDAFANGRLGERGLGQILPIALRDYNEQKGTSLKFDDMYDIDANLEVMAWTVGERIPFYMKRFGVANNWKNKVRIYNRGIGTVVGGEPDPEATQNYIKKVGEYLAKKRESIFANVGIASLTLITIYLVNED